MYLEVSNSYIRVLKISTINVFIILQFILYRDAIWQFAVIVNVATHPMTRESQKHHFDGHFAVKPKLAGSLHYVTSPFVPSPQILSHLPNFFTCSSTKSKHGTRSHAPVSVTSCWPFHPSTAGSSSSETWRPAASDASDIRSSRSFCRGPHQAGIIIIIIITTTTTQLADTLLTESS